MGACTPGGTRSPTVLPYAWVGSVFTLALGSYSYPVFPSPVFLSLTIATDKLKIPVLRQIVNVVSSLNQYQSVRNSVQLAQHQRRTTVKAFLCMHTAPLNKPRAESFSGVPPDFWKMYIEHSGLYHSRFYSGYFRLRLTCMPWISILDTQHAWNQEPITRTVRR